MWSPKLEPHNQPGATKAEDSHQELLHRQEGLSLIAAGFARKRS